MELSSFEVGRHGERFYIFFAETRKSVSNALPTIDESDQHLCPRVAKCRIFTVLKNVFVSSLLLSTSLKSWDTICKKVFNLVLHKCGLPVLNKVF